MVNKTSKIAIVGAGMAGLSCAAELTKRGLHPLIFDKGRGLGGRLSTRRADGGYQFDHGAQFLTPQSDAFGDVLRQAETAGAVSPWPLDQTEQSFVGLPGMTGLAKHLARGLDVQKNLRIERVTQANDAWQMDWAGGNAVFDHVIVATPAPQTIDLLPMGHPLSKALGAVKMDPCLVLMVALDDETDSDVVALRDPTPQISWIARDSNKPGRPSAPCYVAHANPEWSLQHLELDLPEIANVMLPLVSKVLGFELTPNLPYVAAHRWRYALASKPLGQPFIADTSQRLFAGGDWCLGKTVEDAWLSGKAIADAIAGTV